MAAWYRSAIRCRLEPGKCVARMIKRPLDGIVTEFRRELAYGSMQCYQVRIGLEPVA